MRKDLISVTLVLLLSFATLLNESDAGLPDSSLVPVESSYTQSRIGTPSDYSHLLSNIEGYFTENNGQIENDEIFYYSHGHLMSVCFDHSRIVYYLWQSNDEPISIHYTVLFEGARDVEPIAKMPYNHRSNFFFGDNPNKWVSGALNFQEIWYEDLYDDIDLRFFFKDGLLKYEFRVHKGADPSEIQIEYQGVKGLSLEDKSGDLLIHTLIGTIRDSAPIVFQRLGGDLTCIESNYQIINQYTVIFSLSNYDPNLELIIDPGLKYSTFIGGNWDDYGSDMAIDANGNIYLTGSSLYAPWKPSTFPITNRAYDKADNQKYDMGTDVFVLKLNPNTNQLVYSTFIGSDSYDDGSHIFVNNLGNAYITGQTIYDRDGTVFPTTPNVIDRNLDYNSYNPFVLELNPQGSGLVFSTFIGGPNPGSISDLYVDDVGGIYLTGKTGQNWPTTGDAFDRTYHGGWDIFITKLNSDATGFIYSTLVGGSNDDIAGGLAVNKTGCVYVTGMTRSWNFPTTPDVYDEVNNGAGDCFVLKMNSMGSALEFSTFIGGLDYEAGSRILVDDKGCSYVAGITTGNNFPTTKDVYDRTFNGKNDCILFKLNSTAEGLIYSTYFGGSDSEGVQSFSIDDDGSVYITGNTVSNDFPVSDASYNETNNGKQEIYLIKFDDTFSNRLYSTYFGGAHDDGVSGMCLDDNGYIYISGSTSSTDFPITNNAYDKVHNGGGDAFVLKIGEFLPPNFGNDRTPSVVTTGDKFTFDIDISDNVGVQKVSGECWYGNSEDHFEFNMIRSAGSKKAGTWNSQISVWNNTTGSIHYLFYAEDETGNFDTSDLKEILIIDNDPPTIENSTMNIGNSTTGDIVPISIDVEDNICVDEVWIQYWYGNRDYLSTRVRLLSLNQTGFGNGTYVIQNITNPLNSLEPLSFIITANDTADNWIETRVIVVNISDNDNPEIGMDLSDTEATTGDVCHFETTLVDNVGIENVHIVYWFNDDILSAMNETMDGVDTTGIGNGSYVHNSLIIPPELLGSLHYYFNANDTSGNWNRTTAFNLEVFDNDSPIFLMDNSDEFGTTGDLFHFELVLSDNIGIKEAYVRYWFGDDFNKARNASLSEKDIAALGNGIYEYEIQLPAHSLQGLTYQFFAEDLSGIWNSTESTIVDLEDDDPAEFESDSSNRWVTTGDVFHFRIYATDNIAVSFVYVVYWFEGMEETNITMNALDVDPTGNGTYAYNNLRVDEDDLPTIHYYFVAVDSSGNWNWTEEVIAQPRDNDPPIFGAYTTELEAVKGFDLSFSVEVVDNIGVEDVRLEFGFGDDEHSNVSLEGDGFYSIVINVPRHPSGDLHYHFAARDEAGNWVTTKETTLSTINYAPVILEVPRWVVTEGMDASLDLSEYLEDDNDPLSALVLGCSAPNIDVEGLVLHAMYDGWVPDHTIEVSLTDGEDTVFANITVEVVNVNDLPVVTTTPFSNGKVGSLYAYQLEFTDEDTTDSHSFAFLSVPKGMTVLPNGLVLWMPSSDQKGAQEVNISVSDGVGTTYQSWIISVEPGEGAPIIPGGDGEGAEAGKGMGDVINWVIILLVNDIILVVVLAVVLGRRRGGRGSEPPDIETGGDEKDELDIGEPGEMDVGTKLVPDAELTVPAIAAGAFTVLGIRTHCEACGGVMEKGANAYVCECGTALHESCAGKVRICPRCKSEIVVE